MVWDCCLESNPRTNALERGTNRNVEGNHMTQSIKMDRINHLLVIGGTGMLSQAALTLAEHSDAISIVARTRKSLDSLGSRLLDSAVRWEVESRIYA